MIYAKYRKRDADLADAPLAVQVLQTKRDENNNLLVQVTPIHWRGSGYWWDNPPLLWVEAELLFDFIRIHFNPWSGFTSEKLEKTNWDSGKKSG